jgi:hypothetical protein
MNKPATCRLLAGSLGAALLLTACGGGGGGGDNGSTPPSSRFGPSSSLENICTLEGQKRFLRSYLDEVYLWYNEIPEVNPALYNNIPDYFDALLVKTPDAGGQPRDRFSAVLPTFRADDLRQQTAVAAQDASPATALAAATNYVPIARVGTSPAGRRVGYIQFNDHESGAQDELINAFRTVRDGGARDLVLDLRTNSGGFIYIAQAAASMVTGPQNSGKVFEQLRYNDKRNAETQASSLFFDSSVQFAESQYPKGTPLPQLSLPRLYVLGSNLTCSSSESIINGLRGVDVQVILVGQTTCGKPYGFHRKDNCGFAYFPIEFQGFNNKGFGDYTTGFRPTCTVTDNPLATRGGTADPLLAAALVHADTGACPAGTATAQASSAPDASVPAASANPRPFTGRLWPQR